MLCTGYLTGITIRAWWRCLDPRSYSDMGAKGTLVKLQPLSRSLQ